MICRRVLLFFLLFPYISFAGSVLMLGVGVGLIRRIRGSNGACWACAVDVDLLRPALLVSSGTSFLLGLAQRYIWAIIWDI